MYYFGIFLIIYGVFVLAGFIMQFPFLYNNAKSKMLIKMMGKTGYNILLLAVGVVALVGGILLVS
ncbi:MAG: hypothetical protein Q7I99_06465 [Acholeplasmataceae bacterium]|nr:hypothetical protein [Acholeplasmataceae bacterium]